MDTIATSMCMDNDIDLVVFNMNRHGNILKAVQRGYYGTVTCQRKAKYTREILNHAEEKMKEAQMVLGWRSENDSYRYSTRISA